MEEAVADLASRQHGVVTRTQLLEAGLTSGRVERWLNWKRLRQLHRGVYVVGPLVSPRAFEMAAVLASRRGAVISHRTAGTLRELMPPLARRGAVDASVVGGADVRRPAIRVPFFGEELRERPAGRRARRGGPAGRARDMAAADGGP